MMQGYVKSEIHQGIRTIEFFHPQSNSLPANILHDLALAVHQAGEDPDTIVIILRSAGEKTFCAGASFEELESINNEKEGLAFFSGFAHVINAMRLCPKFIIGRVHGKSVGGGVGLVAAVDYAIATEAAEVRLSELAVGIGAFVVGPAVERKIGVSAFSQLAMDAAHWRSADWARKKGLFAEVHASTEDLDDAVRRISHILSQSNPEAMSEMKKMFWQGTSHWDQLLIERAKISGRLVQTDFAKQVIRKMRSMRKQT